MPENENTLQNILRATGLDSVRFAHGIVGNTTYAMCAYLVSVAVIGWALSNQPWFALAVIVLLTLIITYFLNGTWKFADKHPDLALLGGAELLKLRELEMGAKGLSVPPESPTLPDPDTPLILDHLPENDRDSDA